MSRKCGRCRLGEEEGVHFGKNANSNSPDGLHSICKECRRLKKRKIPQKRSPSSDRRCSRCSSYGPFGKSKWSPDRLNPACKKCINEEKKKKVEENKRVIVEAKNKPCKDCHEKFPYWVMDFDHLGKKLFGLGEKITQSKSATQIIAEIAKCDLVCSNCHRNRTYCRLMNIPIQPLRGLQVREVCRLQD